MKFIVKLKINKSLKISLNSNKLNGKFLLLLSSKTYSTILQPKLKIIVKIKQFYQLKLTHLFNRKALIKVLKKV